MVSSLILSSKIQVHRQVPLSDTKISETTKLALHDLLYKFDPIISKNNNDIGQMDLIEMHIATRLDVTPVEACPSTLALKHHMPLPKIDELFALLKGAKYFTALHLQCGFYHIKLDKESIPRSAFTTVFRTFEFLRLPFGLPQGPDFFIFSSMTLLDLMRPPIKAKV